MLIIIKQKDKQTMQRSLMTNLIFIKSKKHIPFFVLFVIFCLIFLEINYAQSNIAHIPTNNIFIELGGNGLFVSLNYEYIFNNNYGVKVGFGTLLIAGISYPIMLNKYFGNEKKIELGFGIVPFSFLEKDSYWGSKSDGLLLIGTIGHHYSKSPSGMLFRYSFTPAYNIADNKFILYLGLSIGVAFN